MYSNLYESLPSFSKFEHDEILAEGFISPALASIPEVQYFDKRAKSASPVERENLLSDAYQAIEPLLNQVHTDLGTFLRRVVPKKRLQEPPQVLSNTKTLKSVVSKVIARGKKLSELTDLVRCAILFGDKSDADEFVDRVKRTVKVVEHDEKKYDKNSEYGYYGSHHLLIVIDGLICEMQVMTKRLWKYKSDAHEIYNKYRDTGGAPTGDDKTFSKALFALGNKVRYRKEDCDEFDDFSADLEYLSID